MSFQVREVRGRYEMEDIKAPYLPPILMTDFYKTIHYKCYAEGTSQLTYYWTARKSRVQGQESVIFFGLQGFIRKYLMDEFQRNFFDRPLDEVLHEYRHFIMFTMGIDQCETAHIESLWKLGYLPIQIKALPEGTEVPIGCPMVEIENTVDGYHWLVGYLETLLSCNLWMPITSATTAHRDYKLAGAWLRFTDDIKKLPYQCSDFSMRGMTSLESAQVSGAAHLLFFNKTANMPAITWLMKYYDADIIQFDNAGTPSTEHSVMCTYGQDEYQAYRQILEVNPVGPISIVSDTYDLWNVINVVLPRLKEEIITREGTTIIRPDSGDPVKIICGDKESKDPNEKKGVVELLYDVFGGQLNEKGYKRLDPHIKVIYGDAITYERLGAIALGLAKKGYALSNVIFGIGSYTYQYVTRDTYGMAFKATNAVINGKSIPIYKDPITDKDAFKKSHRGKVIVYQDNELLKWVDGLDSSDREDNQMRVVYKNGDEFENQTFYAIREKVRSVI